MSAPPFRPLWLLGNPHLQTLAGVVSFPRGGVPSRRRLLRLDDGDHLALEVTTPPGWTDGDPIGVLVHGLTGSHRSAYMMRLAAKLAAQGWRAVRVNLRGCGSGVGLARRPYHGGCSGDVRAALAEVRREAPRSRVTLLGFSLGGNIVLKLAAELGPDFDACLDEVIAVCPSVDLAACYARISRSINQAYERYFTAQLRRAVELRNAAFPDDPHEVPSTHRLYDFDDRYTARRWGFAGVDDYYARASAKPLLEQIRAPTRVALARNDPIIDPTVFADVRLHERVTVREVSGGGHLGFLARPGSGGIHWLDTLVLAWTRNGATR